MKSHLMRESRRGLILHVLDRKGCYNIETAIGYNRLFEEVKGSVGSKTTYTQLLKELETDGLIRKTDQGIYLTKKPLMTVVPLLREVMHLVQTKQLMPARTVLVRFGRTVQQKTAPESLEDLRIVANFIEVAHQALLQLLPHIRALHGPHPYVRVTSDGTKVHLDFRRDRGLSVSQLS